MTLIEQQNDDLSIENRKALEFETQENEYKEISFDLDMSSVFSLNGSSIGTVTVVSN